MTKVVFISHTVDGGVYKVGSHHLARELSGLGVEVAHISTPVSLVHRLIGRGERRRRNLAKKSHEIDAVGTIHAVPRTFLPVTLLPSTRPLNRVLKRIGFENADYWIIDQPLMSDAWKLAKGRTVIYRPTDLYLRGRAARAQRMIMDHCDAVIATSRVVLDALPTGNLPTLIIENGVEFMRFSSPTGAKRRGFVYVGAIDGRFDWEAVINIAAAFPREPVHIFGVLSMEAPSLPANIHIRGPISYEDVPGVLHQALVGLIPFSADPLNAGRSPMKLYEYIAAGLSVVAQAAPAVARAEFKDIAFTYLKAEEAGAAAQLAQKWAQHVRGASGISAGHDWGIKAQSLLDFVSQVRFAKK